ncbi:unnamed protein product [Cyprideis torosa]|uniref:Cytochrome c oxidase assembly factor 3 n=1 Tax=Cyprideis torosa TaxID=163714 RepID=A0A7R8W5U7_9CRUS|nr:unnamed protein product [Cyprideis torosa]CAG0881824.1 unnamed protein product [Cyprideis torosa]
MDDQAKKVVIGADKIDETTLEHMRKIALKNAERARKITKLRSSNVLTAGTLLGGVLSIFVYSMVSVRQETFLDDIGAPAAVPKK